MIQQVSFWVVLLMAVLVFWQLPPRWRLSFLAAVSFGYLATFALGAVCILFGWALAFHLVVRPPDAEGNPSRRAGHVLLIIGVLGLLAYFKYLPPLIAALSTAGLDAQVVVPLGMSFSTFKLVHYVLEVSRGNVTKGPFSELCAYLFLFPIFTAGPIERYDHFRTHQESRWSRDSTVDGVRRLMVGVIKKFFLADTVLDHWIGKHDAAALLLQLDQVHVPKLWCLFILYFAYIYFDFSAYSDIGIGASRLFGLRIMENFRFPLIACNIADFWKRWHISLSQWCQAYVYLPTIGLTRNPYLATYATFLVMGLWHAGSLNRVGWGMYHATGIAAYITWTQFKRKRRWKHLDRGLWRLTGLPITVLFVAGSATFLAVEPHAHLGLYDSLRLLGRLVWLDLPAASA